MHTTLARTPVASISSASCSAQRPCGSEGAWRGAERQGVHASGLEHHAAPHQVRMPSMNPGLAHSCPAAFTRLPRLGAEVEQSGVRKGVGLQPRAFHLLMQAERMHQLVLLDALAGDALAGLACGRAGGLGRGAVSRGERPGVVRQGRSRFTLAGKQAGSTLSAMLKVRTSGSMPSSRASCKCLSARSPCGTHTRAGCGDCGGQRCGAQSWSLRVPTTPPHTYLVALVARCHHRVEVVGVQLLAAPCSL